MRSHPPGAVLTIYFLNEVLGNPALISIAITAVSASLTVIFFRRLLSLEFSHDLSGYLAFLLLLLPSIQIYYAASLDALITGLMLGVISFFVASDSNWSLVVATALLLVVSFLTFGALFLLPVLTGYEWVTRRKVTRALSMIISIVAAYLLVSITVGFNYLGSSGDFLASFHVFENRFFSRESAWVSANRRSAQLHCNSLGGNRGDLALLGTIHAPNRVVWLCVDPG